MTTSSDTALQYGIAPSGYRLPNATHIGRVRLQSRIFADRSRITNPSLDFV
ncbi:MAG TPA: hypothetical protein VK636_14625 [Gemmatimonadaceae bacterium]|nr:hypothetical protein [Gemmatimonadaceae bacterium]